ncbi:M16 family metallopeptidase [Micromonospora sp. NPDC003197]
MEAPLIPAIGPMKPLRVPAFHEQVLSNDLTVTAIRRTGSPLVDMRIRIPFGGVDPSVSSVLARLIGTHSSGPGSLPAAAAAEAIGGGVQTSINPDRLLISAHALGSHLDQILGILASILTAPAYPVDAVASATARLVARARSAASQPRHLVRAALMSRFYGRHPYGRRSPTAAQLQSVDQAAVTDLHRRRIRPDRAHLVLVGDLDPAAVVEHAEQRLGGWTGRSEVPQTSVPGPPQAGPATLLDLPGCGQSSIRVALPAVGRTDPDYESLHLANIIFGGCSSSRWVDNLRETKGYSYNPISSIEHQATASLLLATAEVGSEATAPALAETLRELENMSTGGIDEEELERAKRYALGTLQLGICSQRNLAGLAAIYLGAGLRLDHLVRHAERMVAATLADVDRAAEQFLSPARAVVVVLADAQGIGSTLEQVVPVAPVQPAQTG